MTYKDLQAKLGEVPTDYLVLLLFIAVLPLSEALKNISLVLYLLVWPVLRYRSGRWGGAWRPLDTVIAIYVGLWALSAAAVTASGIDGSGIYGEVKYAILFLFVSRSDYTSQQLARLLPVLVISTLIGLASALYLHQANGTTGYLYLPSAPSHGDTNLFLLVVLVLWLTWVLSQHSRKQTLWRVANYVILFIFAYGLMRMESRTSVALLALSLLLIALSWARRHRRHIARLVFVFSLGLLVIFVAAPGGVAKFVERYNQYGLSDPRIDIFRTAGLAWLQRPLFGFGAGNFKKIAMQDLREVYGDDPSYAWLVLDAKDAHNLYLDTLVQGGITAFLGLVTVLVVWFRYLHSTRFSADMDDLDWMLWTTSAAMLMITLAGGMTNRLLRGEPALLIALLLGIWIAYSYRKTRDASSQNSLCE